MANGDSGSVKRVLVLASGGVDSTACIHYYALQGFNVETLHVNYGHDAFQAEQIALRLVCDHFGLEYRSVTVDTIPWSERSDDEVVGRNLFLASIGIASFRANHGLVSMGLHDGSAYADCSREFQRLVRGVSLVTSRHQIEFDFPFGTWQKRDIFEFCRQNRTPLSVTYSCTKGNTAACGRCLSCLERASLISQVGCSNG